MRGTVTLIRSNQHDGMTNCVPPMSTTAYLAGSNPHARAQMLPVGTRHRPVIRQGPHPDQPLVGVSSINIHDMQRTHNGRSMYLEKNLPRQQGQPHAKCARIKHHCPIFKPYFPVVPDRKSVVKGTSVSVRVEFVGRRSIKKYNK